jgi:hypothetical protein
VGFEDEGGTLELLIWMETGASVDFGLGGLGVEPGLSVCVGRGLLRFLEFAPTMLGSGAVGRWVTESMVSGTVGLDGRSDDAGGLNFDGTVGWGVAVEGLVLGGEGGFELRLGRGVGGKFDGEGGVLALESEVDEAAAGGDVVWRDALSGNRCAGFGFEFSEDAGKFRKGDIEALEDLTLGEAFDRGFAETLRAEEADIFRNQDLGHAQALRNSAGVLASRAAECDEDVVGWVVPLGDGDGADGLGHALVGEVDEAFEERWEIEPLAAGLFDLCEEHFGFGASGFGGDWDAEVGGIKAAKKQVAIGDRERASRAVAGWTRSCAGAVGADAEGAFGLVEPADGATAGRDAFDGDCGGDDVGIADVVLEDVGVIVVVAGDVGAGAAHVE